VERKIDINRTMFLVASKSGSTLEVNILKQYFYIGRFRNSARPKRGAGLSSPPIRIQAAADCGEEGFREIFPESPALAAVTLPCPTSAWCPRR
jgi:transaldolase/glucose-6-phosphate isomerase